MAADPRPLAVVTGAGRGIGRAIALGLAGAGYDLALVGRADLASLEQAAGEAAALGAACSTVLCDISDEEPVDGLFATLGPDLPRLAALVNNAGVAGPRSRLDELSMADVDEVLAVNVRGAILMCRAAIRAMRARGGGAIVNITSQTAEFGGDRLSVYGASKAALNGLTVSLAREAAGFGVRVNAISPGPVLTEPLLALPPGRLEEMKAGLPMGRFCTAEEVAAVAVWLLSGQASYVSGAIVPVHGAR